METNIVSLYKNKKRSKPKVEPKRSSHGKASPHLQAGRSWHPIREPMGVILEHQFKHIKTCQNFLMLKFEENDRPANHCISSSKMGSHTQVNYNSHLRC